MPRLTSPAFASAIVLGVSLAALVPVACTSKKDPANQGGEKTAPSSDAKTPSEMSPVAALKLPLKSDGKPWRVTGSYILVCHAEAPRKKPGTTRSRKEAMERATEALAKVKAPGASFEEVAKEYSEGPRAESTGGRLSIIARLRISPAYREIVEPLFSLKVGEISGIVETSQGLAILKRLPILECAALQIWIQYLGCQGASAECSRTKEEASQLAQEIATKAQQPGTEFSDLVNEYSEDNDRRKDLGGFTGVWAPGQFTGSPAEALNDALFKLEVGGVSDVIETSYGFHIMSRGRPQDYRMAVSQIAIRHSESKWPARSEKRTKEDARKLADEILTKLREGKGDFESLAREHSNDQHASQGGFMGSVSKAAFSEEWDAAAFALNVGEVSKVIETPQGFHIIWRWE